MITGILLALLSCGPTDTTKLQIPTIYLNGVVENSSVDPLIVAISEINATEAPYFVLEINTPGGSVSDGFRLVKAIETSPKMSVCVVDGEGYSMGFYILQSCNVRIMTKRSTLMAHEPAFGSISGLNRGKLKSLLDALNASTFAANEFMCKRLNVSKTVCESKIHNEWWMEWKEAFAVRAVDAVIDNVSQIPDVIVSKD
jgi:ATP-dependent protease ClpP protease subunit